MQSILGQVAELSKLCTWTKDCGSASDFFSHFWIFFFHCPFSDKMKTWHFLQLSSKLWRMWKLDWIPGNTRLETPSCIIQQVRSWFQTVLSAFLCMTEQLLQGFFFCKGVFKKCVFSFFFLASGSNVGSCSIYHWKARLYYRSICFQQPKLFPGLSSLWALVVICIHCFLLLKESSSGLLVCLLL